MDFIISKLAYIGPFFLLLGALIFIHEWGHFIVARICGVRVEIFSIGFGPKLFSWKNGETVYCLSLIPLGGYIKMYGDGNKDNIPINDQSKSFNHQNVFKKIAIVSAGPIMNLIFAFVLFLMLGMLGSPEVAVSLGDINPATPAYQAGLRYGDIIQSVNETPVKYFTDFTKELGYLKDGSNARLKVLRLNGKLESILAPIIIKDNTSPISDLKKVGHIQGLNLLRRSSRVGIDYKSNLLNNDNGFSSIERIIGINSIKIKSFYELKKAILGTSTTQDLKISIKKASGQVIQKKIPSNGLAWNFANLGFVNSELMVDQVQRGSPAEKAGLKAGDQVLKISGVKLVKWEDLVAAIKSTAKGESVTLLIANTDGEKNISVTPVQTQLLTSTGQVKYRPTIGILSGLEYLPPVTVIRSFTSIKDLFKYAVTESIHWVKTTFLGFKKLLTGEISHKTLSGVISIGKIAKDSLNIGWTYFIKIMAIISINLFLLNLLPIPVLDGGHLFFYFIEVVTGNPVSMRVKMIGQQIGVVLILLLIVYTIFNDFSQIIFSGW